MKGYEYFTYKSGIWIQYPQLPCDIRFYIKDIVVNSIFEDMIKIKCTKCNDNVLYLEDGKYCQKKLYTVIDAEQFVCLDCLYPE